MEVGAKVNSLGIKDIKTKEKEELCMVLDLVHNIKQKVV